MYNEIALFFPLLQIVTRLKKPTKDVFIRIETWAQGERYDRSKYANCYFFCCCVLFFSRIFHHQKYKQSEKKKPSNLCREIWSLSSTINSSIRSPSSAKCVRENEQFSSLVSKPPRISDIKKMLLTNEIKEKIAKSMVEHICSRHYRPNQIDKNCSQSMIAYYFTFVRSPFFFVCEILRKNSGSRHKKGFFTSSFRPRYEKKTRATRNKNRKARRLCVRTWLLPQNFKAHKATKREKKVCVSGLAFWNLRCSQAPSERGAKSRTTIELPSWWET